MGASLLVLFFAVSTFARCNISTVLDAYSRVLDRDVDAAALAPLPAALAAAIPDCPPAEWIVPAVQALHLTHLRVVKDMLALAAGDSVSVTLADAAAKAWAWSSAPLTALLAATNHAIDAPGPLGYTALQHATAYGEHAAMEALLLAGAQPGVATDALRLTPLHLAARACDTNAYSLLIRHGAAVPALDAHGRSPADLMRLAGCAGRDDTSPCGVIPEARRGNDGGGGGWRPPSPRSEIKAVGVPACRAVLPAVTNLTAEFFYTQHLSLALPLVFDSPATDQNLLSRAALIQAFGTHDVFVSEIPYGDVFQVRAGAARLDEFMAYMDRAAAAAANSEPEREPLYVFDHEFLDRHMGAHAQLPTAITAHLGQYPQARQFYLGPENSGAPHHFHEDAVNVLVYGLKQWWLSPPGVACYEKRHPNLVSAVTSISAVHTCLQYPGDMIYVPRLWGHSTLNLAESVGFAVEFDNSDCANLQNCPNYVL